MYRNIVLFSGPLGEVWETDGTAAGTFNLTPNFSSSQNGLNPLYFTAYNNIVLFMSSDNSGPVGLWETNGTTAGTAEIGGAGSTSISGANPLGLHPGDMIVYNGKVLFRGISGLAGSPLPGLWITDGTAAGTSEIGGPGSTGIVGANSSFMRAGPGPNECEFTLFNGKVLFNAADSANNQGLWITDGTAAGTSELAPIAGAFAVGSPGTDILGSFGNMAVLGNKVLFRGTDQRDTPGSLWVTDGTAAGTSEIGGPGNHNIQNSPDGFTGVINGVPRSELAHGMVPSDLTTFNGKVLFAAFDDQLDSNGYYVPSMGLWVSDGTAGGTTEIGGQGSTGIAGALHYGPSTGLEGGIFDSQNIEYPDFTVYNNKVLFAGCDLSFHYGLWVTDGTAVGTSEIGGLQNAGITSSGGLSFSGSQSPDFTVFNGVVLFNGIDGLGRSGLWVTDGTATGTRELNIPNFNLGSPNSELGPDFTIATAPPPCNFHGGNTSDILFRNVSTGDTWVEGVTNGTFASWSQLGGSDTRYASAGVGDFDANGTCDILFRNTSSGDTWYEGVSNGGFGGWHQIGGSDTRYTSYGSGDFYGNGIDDPLFRNNSTGDTWFEELSNGAFKAWHQLGGSNTSYALVGMGDFDGNDSTDVIFRNNSTGDTWVESISNGLFAGWKQVGGSDTHYTSYGAGDFYGNGQSDFFYRNNATGDMWFEAFTNGQFAGWHQIGGSDTSYSFAGMGDYNGDNCTDILFRNSAGDTWFGMMSNGQFASWQHIGGSSSSYAVPGSVGPPTL